MYCVNNPNVFIDANGKFLLSAAIGAGIGAVIGAGATVASSIVKGEKVDIGEVVKNGAIGAGTGALIGSGVGAVTAVAEAVVGGTAGAAVASAMSTGAAICGTMSATMEAGLEIATNPDHDIHLGQIAVSGVGGAIAGLITGSGVGRAAASVLNGVNSIGVSVVNDIQKGESLDKIIYDATINGAAGAIAGFAGGSGATKGVYSAGQHQYMFKAGGQLIIGQSSYVNIYGYASNALQKIGYDLTKGLGVSALTTAIGGPVTSFLTSLFNGNQDNNVEPTEEIIVEDGECDE